MRSPQRTWSARSVSARTAWSCGEWGWTQTSSMPRSRPSSRLSTEWPSPSATGCALSGRSRRQISDHCGYSTLEPVARLQNPALVGNLPTPTAAIIGSRWLLSEPEPSASRSRPGRRVQDQQWCTTVQRPSTPRACGFLDLTPVPGQLEERFVPDDVAERLERHGPPHVDRIEEVRSAGVDHGDLPEVVVVGKSLVCAIQRVIGLTSTPPLSGSPLGPRRVALADEDVVPLPHGDVVAEPHVGQLVVEQAWLEARRSRST